MCRIDDAKASTYKDNIVTDTLTTQVNTVDPTNELLMADGVAGDRQSLAAGKVAVLKLPERAVQLDEQRCQCRSH